MAQTREKPKPPAPPKLPTKDDLLSAAERNAQAAPEDDEQDEGSTVEQIRADLQDAYESISSAWEKLDKLDSEQS